MTYEPLSDMSLDLLDAQASGELKQMNRRVFSHQIDTKEFLYWCEKVGEWSDWKVIDQVANNSHNWDKERLTFLRNEIKSRKCSWEYRKEVILNFFTSTNSHMD